MATLTIPKDMCCIGASLQDLITKVVGDHHASDICQLFVERFLSRQIHRRVHEVVDSVHISGQRVKMARVAKKSFRRCSVEHW